jgi:hypothetical protein
MEEEIKTFFVDFQNYANFMNDLIIIPNMTKL